MSNHPASASAHNRFSELPEITSRDHILMCLPASIQIFSWSDVTKIIKNFLKDQKFIKLKQISSTLTNTDIAYIHAITCKIKIQIFSCTKPRLLSTNYRLFSLLPSLSKRFDQLIWTIMQSQLNHCINFCSGHLVSVSTGLAWTRDSDTRNMPSYLYLEISNVSY
jgi:hypothetical protein